MAPVATLAVLGSALAWALVVLVTYFAGAGLFLLGGLSLAAAFAATVPAVWLILKAFWALLRVAPSDRLRVAALMTAPGLLINAVLFLARTAVLPGFTPGAADRFAAWVMWACGAMLVIGLRASEAGRSGERGNPTQNQTGSSN